MHPFRRSSALLLAGLLLAALLPVPARAVTIGEPGGTTYTTGCTSTYLEADTTWRNADLRVIDMLAMGPSFRACYDPNLRSWSISSYRDLGTYSTGTSFARTLYPLSISNSTDGVTSIATLKVLYTFTRKDPRTGKLATLKIVDQVKLMGSADSVTHAGFVFPFGVGGMQSTGCSFTASAGTSALQQACVLF